MVCRILFVLCIFTAGLRVQSVPTSTLLPVSLPAKTTPTMTIWTSSPQSPPASPTSGTPSSSAVPVTVPSVQTSLLPKNVSIEPSKQPRGQETTSPTSTWEGTNTDPLSTNSEVHLTPTPTEHSSGTPEASVPATGSQSPAESPAVTSPQTPASSPSPLPTSPADVSSTSISTNHSSTETTTKPTAAPTTPESPAEEHSSGHTPTSHAATELVPMETTPQTTLPAKVTCVLVDMETTTTSPRVIMQEVEHALSSGSIAAITVTVIAVVLLVFGVAAYLKIRHSSYGRLLDDHDYGSWGNYNNPLYDDS
ncbi:PREDICTED: prostate androgen-regulated mucin-like protein 1 [Hipposideros armiger]|uniref:Prostate androgen-regulated mucin-like protein 1 n=1 Tax=Hipposideros armiger TaxID=186990 RepID=A0A8B7PY10_HIPAR|nr:PREDICTED: prostate androgen-regulated mucin-like protein 1 [Hipposideros armiger]